MSDTQTTERPDTDTQSHVHEATGHGRHRGPVSANDAAATPRGRHRKPSDQTESAA